MRFAFLDVLDQKMCFFRPEDVPIPGDLVPGPGDVLLKAECPDLYQKM
jgi:hypothetical protein